MVAGGRRSVRPSARASRSPRRPCRRSPRRALKLTEPVYCNECARSRSAPRARIPAILAGLRGREGREDRGLLPFWQVLGATGLSPCHFGRSGGLVESEDSPFRPAARPGRFPCPAAPTGLREAGTSGGRRNHFAGPGLDRKWTPRTRRWTRQARKAGKRCRKRYDGNHDHEHLP